MTVDARADVVCWSTAELRSQVRDLVTQWREAQRFAPTCDSWLRSYDPAFTKELAKRGLIGMTWPRRYGGGEYSNVDRLAVTEELLRAGAPVSAHWIADRQIGPAILRHGSEHLRDSILPGITRGEYLFCLGLSEPEAGSDLAAVRTSAERVDGGWLITGRKMWTSGAHHATHCYVLARTEKADRKHVGLSEFVVDMTTPGIDVTPIVDMAGDHHFNETVFDRVFVPESQSHRRRGSRVAASCRAVVVRTWRPRTGVVNLPAADTDARAAGSYSGAGPQTRNRCVGSAAGDVAPTVLGRGTQLGQRGVHRGAGGHAQDVGQRF